MALWDSMPDHSSSYPGCFSCCGHAIDRLTWTCRRVEQSSNRMCTRRISDILSEWRNVKVGDKFVSCYGAVSGSELETLTQAGEMWERAVAQARTA